MNAKKFLKRFNRGVALGIAVFIGFGIYVAADSVAFKKSKPEIQQFLKDYIEEYETLGITSEEYRNIELVKYSEEEKKRIQTQFRDVVEKYWYEIENKGFLHGRYANDIISEVNDTICVREPKSRNKEGVGYVDKCSINVDNNIKITKKGPNIAQANLSFEAVVECAGNPAICLPNDIRNLMYCVDFYAFERDEEKNVLLTDEKRKMEYYSGDVTLTLLKKDGEWKIICCGYSQGEFSENIDKEAEGREGIMQ